MPVFLLVALFLAFGADSFILTDRVPPSTISFRLELIGFWLAAVAVVARLTSTLVEYRDRRSDGKFLPKPRRMFQIGSKLVSCLTLGGYAWAILGLGWTEVVRSVWGWRDSILVDEVLILVPFIAAQVAGWWGLARGEQVITHSSVSALFTRTPPSSTGRHVIKKTRESLGMVLSAALVFAFGQDVARKFWPAEVTQPAYQLGLMVGLGSFVLIMAPAFVRLSWPTHPLPDGPLRERLERVATRFRFRFSDILVWETDGAVVNAGVTGASPWFRYVLLSDALIDGLNEHEVAAVFGHEVGHARHRHLAFFGLFFVGSVGVLTLIGASIDERKLLAILPFSLPSTWGTMAQGATVLTLALAYFGLVFGYLSRRFERQADVFGCRAVSCDQPACPPHLDPDSTLAPTPASQSRLDLTRPICPVGLRTFVNALRAVATLNGIDPSAKSWRHGSIAHRAAFLESLEHHPETERRFQSSVNRLRLALCLILALALILAFQSGAIDQLGV